MTLKQHTLQASAISIILSPFLGLDAIVVFLSTILIDIDHYFDFVVVCKRFGIRDMFKYHNPVWQKKHKMYLLSIFHTVEIFILLFIIGFWWNYFWLILSGFCVHFLFDLYHLYKHNALSDKAFSIIEYFIKCDGLKGYPVPEKDFWDIKDKKTISSVV